MNIVEPATNIYQSSFNTQKLFSCIISDERKQIFSHELLKPKLGNTGRHFVNTGYLF